jgi:hypothetical protein
MENLFAWLGNIVNLITLATFGISLATYFKVQTEAQKIRNSLKNLPPVENLRQSITNSQGISTIKPVALGFSLTPTIGSIKKSIEDFLTEKKWKMPVEEVEMEGIHNEQDVQEFYEKVRLKKRELELEGYTEVHLFFSGPVQAGVIVGGLLSNWKPVKLYHKQQGGGYVYWMPLVKL